jgi:hypothetical protein
MELKGSIKAEGWSWQDSKRPRKKSQRMEIDSANM